MICCLTKRTNSSTNSFAVRAPLLTIMILLSITTHRTFGAVAPKQKIFATPDEAVAALIKAAKEKDTKPLLEILGPDAKSFVETSDPVNDRESRERFTKAYEDFHALTKASDTQMNLEVGKDRWPFPIPLVKTSAGWIFDTKVGKEEITNRRIGRNELDVIRVCLAYVDAQREYYRRDPDGDKMIQYAQKFLTTKGKRDGLYYETKAGEPPSPGSFGGAGQGGGIPAVRRQTGTVSRLLLQDSHRTGKRR